ncbi:hypothetical protein CC85DRAFT_195462 [Cutaneotrichosporon oleaginosum]|uniref:Uncharacterized protein n=1 Tax=Cutaneotrichosporon oleaginosum TaxID=879819 RepID=A0A0J1AW11_9TREE|nr:uncharacterized protein CC85DRAFT_195462 [Cutaneotrichosporon oleaginosum]KLT39459.1 hypothetical protein CC85DRAFT_195462 [Cutaneotrichosporon oleaginosum]TXT09966.1 hypothetical protein COLE_03900 [Cutaneotrichosporon oleaginosum]
MSRTPDGGRGVCVPAHNDSPDTIIAPRPVRTNSTFSSLAPSPQNHATPSDGGTSGYDTPVTDMQSSDGSRRVHSPRTPVARAGSREKRRPSTSSSSSPPSTSTVPTESTTDITTPLPSASGSDSRTSYLHRRSPKSHAHKPNVPVVGRARSDDEPAASGSSVADISGNEGSQGDSVNESSRSGASRTDSGAFASASASASAGSDSSEPFPKPGPRNAVNRIPATVGTSESSSDPGEPAITRLRRPVPSPAVARMPQPTIKDLVTATISELINTAGQADAIHRQERRQASTPRVDGYTSSEQGGSEAKDQLSQLPQRPFGRSRPNSQYFYDRNEWWERGSNQSSRTVHSNHSTHSAHSVHSNHSAHSQTSVRSEPLMSRNEAPTTMMRALSVSGALRPRRTTRPHRAADIEAACRSLIDLTAYPISPLGEVLGLADESSSGLYHPDLTPAWQRIAPRVRNTSALAPHGSFTTRRGSQSLSSPSKSRAPSESSRRSRTSHSHSHAGSGPPTPRLGLVTAPVPAPRDLAADLGGATAHLTPSQIVDLEHAATLGDQLAAYRLGWERRGSAGLPRNASSDSLKSRRSTSGRRISIEIEPSFHDRDYGPGSPQQHGMCFFSGRRINRRN